MARAFVMDPLTRGSGLAGWFLGPGTDKLQGPTFASSIRIAHETARVPHTNAAHLPVGSNPRPPVRAGRRGGGIGPACARQRARGGGRRAGREPLPRPDSGDVSESRVPPGVDGRYGALGARASASHGTS